MTIRFLTIALWVFPFFASSQNVREKDLSLWIWLQFEKRMANNQYVEFQYQVRFNNNISQFNRTNLNFIYGVNFLRHLQLEGLYQLATNYKIDHHTLFLGLTYKLWITQRFSIFYRTSFQAIRNYFTGDIRADKPYSEWRNRIRIRYKINNLYLITLSAEPYFKFQPTLPIHLSRIRFVSEFHYRFNKYQMFSFFYLMEPDIISYSKLETDYVFGVIYHFRLPNK